MTSIPLVRMLTDAGYGSRRDVSQLIKAGLVQVNGQTATGYTQAVDPDVDSIVVTGESLKPGATRRIYLMLHKPEGYLSTTEDDRERPTVLELLPEHIRAAGLHPAGRLDEDSTGLLILTNDGQLTYELTHPRFEHEKEYWIATTGRLTDADIERLEAGVEIEGQTTWPARVRILLGKSPYTYSITIHEGRKRQVRMMLAAIDQHVALLKRVRLGGLFLGDLAEGSWRQLSPAEVKELLRKRPLDIRQSGVGHTSLPATPVGSTTPDRSREPQALLVAGSRRQGVSRNPARPGIRREYPATPQQSVRRAPQDERHPVSADRRAPGLYATRGEHPTETQPGAPASEYRRPRLGGEPPSRRFSGERAPRREEHHPYTPHSTRDDRPRETRSPERFLERRGSRPVAEDGQTRRRDDRRAPEAGYQQAGARTRQDSRPPLRRTRERPYEADQTRAIGERPYRRPTPRGGMVDFERGTRPSRTASSDRPMASRPGVRPFSAERGTRPSRTASGDRPMASRPGVRPFPAQRGTRPSRTASSDRPMASRPGVRPFPAERAAGRANRAPYSRGLRDAAAPQDRPRTTARQGGGASQRPRPQTRAGDATPPTMSPSRQRRHREEPR